MKIYFDATAGPYPKAARRGRGVRRLRQWQKFLLLPVAPGLVAEAVALYYVAPMSGYDSGPVVALGLAICLLAVVIILAVAGSKGRL